MAKSPLEIWEETAALIEELRGHAAEEWEEMSALERAASDETIGDLETNLLELSDDYALEILEEQRERLAVVFDRYTEEMQSAREYDDPGAAGEYLQALRDLLQIDVMLCAQIELEEGRRILDEDDAEGAP